MRELGNRIVVASHNEGKLYEIAALIAPFGLEAKSAAEYGLPEPEETGTTFEENAYLKAFAAASATGLPALSDDSGICVDALDGEPGVYTADWAETGNGRDFDLAMRKVQEKLAAINAVTPEQRSSRFVAVICLAFPNGEAEYYRGEIEGHVVWPPRGKNNFGYDPMFQPEGYDTTFGEMETEDKHGWAPGQDFALSHRARAFQKFARARLGVE